jgi:hypothetical protein
MNDATFAALHAFPDQLEVHYTLIPATHKHWAPASWEGVPSEALTAIEQVCHVRDIEIEGYRDRFERTLAEETPFLPAIDTDALARDRRYGESDAAQALAEFRSARATTLRLLERLTPAQFGRSAVFDGYGPVTLRGLVHFLCSHDQQHLAGLQWLLGKMDSNQ